MRSEEYKHLQRPSLGQPIPEKRPGWLLIFTDISQENGYIVHMVEATAYAMAAEYAADMAQSDLEEFDWEEGPPEQLNAIITAFKEGRFKDAYDAWEDYRSEYEPLDEDVEIIEIDVLEK